MLGILTRDLWGIAVLNLPSKQATDLNQQSLLQGLEKIGLLYVMLLAGIQMNLSNLKKIGMRSLLFGLFTFSIPFLAGTILGYQMALGLLSTLLLGIICSPHTLVSYPIMMGLGIAQAEAVSIAVGGSVITSVLTLVSLSILQAVHGGVFNVWIAIKLFLLLPLFTAIMLWLIPKLGAFFVSQKEETTHSVGYLFVLCCLFVAASGTLILGVDSIVGAFIAGLALNPLVAQYPTLMKQIEFVGNNFFIPIFLISVGVLLDPTILLNVQNLGMMFTLIVVAVASKYVAARFAGALFCYSNIEVMTMFSLTLSRAALVLVIAVYGRSTNLFTGEIFNAAIGYIVITCLIGPLLANAYGQKLARRQRTTLTEAAVS